MPRIHTSRDKASAISVAHDTAYVPSDATDWTDPDPQSIGEALDDLATKAAAGGEANTASNLGAGVGVYEQKSGVDIQLNSLRGGHGIAVSEDDPNNEIDIDIDLMSGGGLGFNFTDKLFIDIGTLTEDTTPASGDWFLMETGGALRKVDKDNMPGGLNDVVDDTSPQLGGDLDVNGQAIVHATGIPFEIPDDTEVARFIADGLLVGATSTPDGTGTIQVDCIGDGTTAVARMAAYSNTVVHNPRILLQKARGSVSSKSAVAANDIIFFVQGRQWEGAGWGTNSGIKGIATAANTAELQLLTSNQTNRLTCEDNADITIEGTNAQLNLSADGSIRWASDAISIYSTTNKRIEVDGTGIGFNGATPIARPNYTLSNVSTDRTLDADSTSEAELADVLGTLIQDLIDYGILQ